MGSDRRAFALHLGALKMGNMASGTEGVDKSRNRTWPELSVVSPEPRQARRDGTNDCKDERDDEDEHEDDDEDEQDN
jgi:hypothetical protein